MNELEKPKPRKGRPPKNPEGVEWDEKFYKRIERKSKRKKPISSNPDFC